MKSEPQYRQPEEAGGAKQSGHKLSTRLTVLVLSFIPILLFFGVAMGLQYKAQKSLSDEVSKVLRINEVVYFNIVFEAMPRKTG